MLPVGQVRWRPGGLAADERRVGVVREHLYLAPAGDVGRGAEATLDQIEQAIGRLARSIEA